MDESVCVCGQRPPCFLSVSNTINIKRKHTPHSRNNMTVLNTYILPPPPLFVQGTAHRDTYSIQMFGSYVCIEKIRENPSSGKICKPIKSFGQRQTESFRLLLCCSQDVQKQSKMSSPKQIDL